MKSTAADLPFEELRRVRCSNGRHQVLIRRSDGAVERLWPDQVDSRRINQALRKKDLESRKANGRAMQA